MAFATLDEKTRMWWEQHGEGEPLLQLGGAGSGHRSFGFIRDLMVGRRLLVDVDIPGYGDSSEALSSRSIQGWAADVAAFIEAIDLGPIDVHGSSMGGMIALSLAAEHPDRVRRLVVNGAAAKLDWVSRARIGIWRALAAAGGLESEELSNALAADMLRREELDSDPSGVVASDIRAGLLSACTPDTFDQACTAMMDMDLLDDLQRITAPTLVIVGERDELTTPSDAEMIVERIPDAQLRILEGVGHVTMREAPQEVARAVFDFLGESEAA